MTYATKKFLAAVFALILFADSTYGQGVKPDSARRAAWQQFQQEHGAAWKVRWDEKTGTPSTVLRASAAAGSAKSYAGAPEQAARAFLGENQRLFGMEASLPDLKLLGVRRLRKVDHVRFQQTYEGIPVYEAEYLVHLDAGGHVVMANGIHYPKIDAPTTPDVSEAAAEQTALSDIESNPKRSEITRELLIYPEKEQFHLAWKLTIPTEPFGGWVYFVDAQSGTVLEKYNQLMDYLGTGKVYPKHPDNSSLTTEALRRLDGSGRLRGTYARVLNDAGSEAYASNLSFQYSPNNTHFDEVNLYYHVDKFRKSFVNGLDDNGNSLGFTQITAHAHAPVQDINGDGQPDPNAYFDRGDQGLYFNDDAVPYDGIKDFAKEDKVIYHEYGHAVIYDQNVGITSNCEEEGSISEGVPDYFAGAHTGRTRILDYAAPLGERNMAGPGISSYSAYESADGTYPQSCPNGGVESHDGGEFFSAVLWEVRNAPGSDAGKIDEVVYAAFSYVGANPTFEDFRDAMVAEDQAAFGGAHKCAIKNTFARNGIGSQGLTVTATGDNTLQEGEEGTWTANASCAPSSTLYDWAYRPLGSSDAWTVIFGGNGQQLSHSFCEDVTLRVTASYNGLYASDLYDVYVTSAPGECNAGGTLNASSFSFEAQSVPDKFALKGSTPNPFRGQTRIHYALPEAAEVELIVYDVLGREVARPVERRMPAGFHEASFEAEGLPSGVYVYRLRAGAFAGSGRMVLVK